METSIIMEIIGYIFIGFVCVVAILGLIFYVLPFIIRVLFVLAGLIWMLLSPHERKLRRNERELRREIKSKKIKQDDKLFSKNFFKNLYTPFYCEEDNKKNAYQQSIEYYIIRNKRKN